MPRPSRAAHFCDRDQEPFLRDAQGVMNNTLIDGSRGNGHFGEESSGVLQQLLARAIAQG